MKKPNERLFVVLNAAAVVLLVVMLVANLASGGAVLGWVNLSIALLFLTMMYNPIITRDRPAIKGVFAIAVVLNCISGVMNLMMK